MPLIIPANTLSSGDFVTNSLRISPSDDGFLERTTSGVADSNRKTWTFSWWAKLTVGVEQHLYGFRVNADNMSYLRLNSDGQMRFANEDYGGTVHRVQTNRYFRDPSAWFHIVLRVDTTQSTEANRVRFYINGSEETSMSSTDYPAQNYDLEINQADAFVIGAMRNTNGTTTGQVDGYLSEVHFVDGQSYAPTVFGEYNDNGVWIPKDCKADITYGTRGFYMQFKETGTSANSSGMGADTSGNNNHFTPNNLVALDITTDTPQNNFATLNPIDVGTNLSQCTFSEGNCKVVKSGTTSSNGDQPVGSMAFSQGKWYWEIKGVSNNENLFIGVFNDVLGGIKPYHNNYFYGIYGDGTGSNSQIYASQESSQVGYGIDNGTCFSDNDIIQIGFDADNYRLYVGRNGSWTDDNASGSGTITSGSGFNESTPTGYYQIPSGTAQGGFWRAVLCPAGGSVNFTSEINFGNPSFSISSGNADANGYGNFEYAPPSGYYALCTKNLAEYG
mgnify:CR=1 FL=1